MQEGLLHSRTPFTHELRARSSTPCQRPGSHWKMGLRGTLLPAGGQFSSGVATSDAALHLNFMPALSRQAFPAVRLVPLPRAPGPILAPRGCGDLSSALIWEATEAGHTLFKSPALWFLIPSCGLSSLSAENSRVYKRARCNKNVT